MSTSVALAIVSAFVIGTVFGFIAANLLEGASRRAAQEDFYARWRAGEWPWTNGQPTSLSEVVAKDDRMDLGGERERAP